MIREERDPAWWAEIANHPAVRGCMMLSGDLPDLTTMITDTKVKPWASENGGFLFFQRDGLGSVYELHTLFRPAGWGREVAASSKEAFSRLFCDGADVVFTWEVGSNPKSRPPLSHGWKTAGPFVHRPELAAEARTWTLTREAWDRSPARRRHQCLLSRSSP